MKKIMQEKYGVGRGDCLRACVASVLNQDISTIPDFGEHNEKWFQALYDWCMQENIGLIHLKPDTAPIGLFNTHAIAIYRLENNEERHAMVCRHDFRFIGEDGCWEWARFIVHNPSKIGCRTEELEEIIILVPGQTREIDE